MMEGVCVAATSLLPKRSVNRGQFPLADIIYLCCTPLSGDFRQTAQIEGSYGAVCL